MTRSRTRPSAIRAFLDSEAAGGVVLMAVAALAMAVANSPASDGYFALLHQRVGGLDLLHWINDGLMAVFFLLVGLEIKRELVDGELNSWPRRVLPGMAAAGGMAVPAIVYLLLQRGDPAMAHGWAIPAATDIAFALGVLSLLGRRVPASLKVFLTALAILDDLGAVAIIALFYSHGVRPEMLGGAAMALGVLVALNRGGVSKLWPYLTVGVVLWAFVLNSGIHATLAGVALAFTIPLKSRIGERTPLHRMEHGLKNWVAFGVLPVFGFANAGVSLAGLQPGDLLQPVPLGVMLGLFLGKQAGVFLAAGAAIRLGWARLPSKASWRQLYGVCILCGVGFTMSLFIGLLAFRDPALQDAAKLGVLAGSLLSAGLGALVLLGSRSPQMLESTRAQ